jgi:predicted nucleic acid-binding protein
LITYLVDTSAAARMLANPEVQQQWQEELGAGVIGLCDLVELELLYSARSLADRLDKKETFEELFSWVTTPDGVWARAHQVQQLLTDRGEHRSAGTVDLLIAAIAELHRLVVLHYDRDFDTVARATGQPAVWVTKPGSIR